MESDAVVGHLTFTLLERKAMRRVESDGGRR
jgi:hypothetical protein